MKKVINISVCMFITFHVFSQDFENDVYWIVNDIIQVMDSLPHQETTKEKFFSQIEILSMMVYVFSTKEEDSSNIYYEKYESFSTGQYLVFFCDRKSLTLITRENTRHMYVWDLDLWEARFVGCFDKITREKIENVGKDMAALLLYKMKNKLRTGGGSILFIKSLHE